MTRTNLYANSVWQGTTYSTNSLVNYPPRILSICGRNIRFQAGKRAAVVQGISLCHVRTQLWEEWQQKKKKKRGGGHKCADVCGHEGGEVHTTSWQIRRCIRSCRSRGAFSRHQAALIALSVEGYRQVASGPLSEMIQNNSACQEAHGRPLKAKAV